MYLYRRHLRSCRHRAKGRNAAGCHCPVWVDGFLHGSRYHKSLNTTDWQKAQRDVDALDSPGEVQTKSIADAVAMWETALRTQHIRESTLRKYSRLMKQFSAWCNQERYSLLRQITSDILDDFRASRKHIAANTSIKELQTFRTWFTFCQSRGWCSTNPAKAIKPPKQKPNEVVPYTNTEIAAMIAACDEIGQQSYERLRGRGLILLLRHTGLRISDALMLRKDRVRDKKIMLFTRKTGGHILLPIPPELEVALECLPLPKPNTKDNGYFFWNGEATAKRLLESAERLLRSVFKKSGVINGHAHRFRHTLATELLANGATEKEVADILGISPNIVEKHYAKWSENRQNRIFELMRRFQEKTIACPFCNAEGHTKTGVCRECEGAGRIALVEKVRK